MKKYALTVKRLNVHARNFVGQTKSQILKSVSFNLPIGKICTFVGHNGAGKTTTIKSILGLRKITSGRIEIFDKPISDITSKRPISYIPERGNHEPIKVRAFLRDIGKFYRLLEKETDRKAIEILHYFDLKESLLNQKLNKLSTGQNKIIMFIQAFLAQSQLIIADEPTDNLDPENRDLFWDFIGLYHKQHPQTTFLIVTHNLDEIEKYTDYLIFIDHGQIKYTGSYKRSSGLRQRYRLMRER